MRVLWMADNPTEPSGYGNVTRFVCAGLADRGHHVSILCKQPQGLTCWHNCAIYPIGFRANELLNYLRRLQPDVLVTLTDVWQLAIFNYPATTDFMRTADIPWLLYYPINGDLGESVSHQVGRTS